jgi:hypothetical protein
LSRTTVDSNFFHGPIEFEITRVNCNCNLIVKIEMNCNVINYNLEVFDLKFFRKLTYIIYVVVLRVRQIINKLFKIF